MEKSITYFEKSGEENTNKVISLVKDRLKDSDIKYVAIASASGESAIKLANALEDVTIINVTHHAGFHGPNQLDISEDTRSKLKNMGVVTFVGSHALSGVGKGIAKQLGGLNPVEIVAQTYRTFSQGIKVCAEITIMLADAGLVPVGEEIIAIGGTGHGVDTAAVITPVNMTKVFDIKFHEIIAMPRD